MIGSGARPPAKQMATAAGQGEENPRRNPAAGHAQKPEGFAQPFSLLPITLQLAEIHPWRPFGSCRAFWLSWLNSRRFNSLREQPFPPAWLHILNPASKPSSRINFGSELCIQRKDRA